MHLKKVFDILQIPFWLEKGTAVGAARHGEFVPWDSDVDLSVFTDDMQRVSKTKQHFKDSDFELYYVNGHYGIRNKETKEHLICLLPHKIIGKTNYWVEYIPPFTYLVNALELHDYDVPDINYIETPLKHFSLPPKVMEFLANITMKFNRQKLISFVISFQNFFHLYKKKYVSPSSHIESFDTLSLYGIDFNVPKSIDSYLTLLFGDWRVPRHKGKVIVEWNGEKLPMRYE